MPHNKHNASKIKTTLGELTAAYYEAALGELKDEKLAQKVAQDMVKEALRRFQR